MKKIRSFLVFVFCTYTSYSSSFGPKFCSISPVLVDPLHALCHNIGLILENYSSRKGACFISRAYPGAHDEQQTALNSWCNAFNDTLKKAGIITYYDEKGYHPLSTGVHSFINEMGNTPFVFLLLTPAYKTHAENGTGWLTDELSCYLAKRSKNPVGCYPILFADTLKNSVPEKLEPIQNYFYHSIARPIENLDIEWPTFSSFSDLILQLLTPNEMGLTQWVCREGKAKIQKEINTYKKITTIQVFDTPVLALTSPHMKVKVQNVSSMFDVFFHERKNEQGQNFLSIIDKKLKEIATYSGPVLQRAAHIIGHGGIGKTYLARRYAYQTYKNGQFDLIWWLSCEVEEDFDFGIRCLYAAMNEASLIKGISTDPLSQFNEIEKALELSFFSWLIICDNISNNFLKNRKLFKFSGNKGHILTTSRHMNKGEIIDLGCFSHQESVNYFKNHILQTGYSLNDNDEKLLHKIAVKLLHCLPLAIAQSTTYIRTENISLKQYIKEFSKDLIGLLMYKNDDDFSQPVLQSFLLSLDKLSIHAKNLLYKLCFLAPDDIPIYTLNRLFDNEKSFRSYFLELQNQGLIFLKGRDQFTMASIHRLYKHIGKEVFFNQKNAISDEKNRKILLFNQLYKELVCAWKVYIEKIMDEEFISKKNAKEWYQFFKNFEKCIKHFKDEIVSFEELSLMTESSSEMNIVDSKPILHIEALIWPITSKILSKFQNQPDMDFIMWNEAGLLVEYAKEIKEDVDYFVEHLQCNKLSLYKLIKKYDLNKKHLKSIHPYITKGVTLWDLKFLLKVLIELDHIKSEITTYMDIIMQSDRSYPGLACALSIYAFRKLKIIEPLSPDEISNLFSSEYLLELYSNAEKNYVLSSYMTKLERVDVLKKMASLYSKIRNQITKNTPNYYNTILYCYEKFGEEFIEDKLVCLDGLEAIKQMNKTKEIVKTKEEALSVYETVLLSTNPH